MSQTTLFIVVIALFVGLPILIVGSMLFAYEGNHSRSRRVLDLLLFHPMAFVVTIVFVIMIGAIIFDADWGLGVELPFDTYIFDEYIIRFLLPTAAIASSLYLLITRPADLKKWFGSEDTDSSRHIHATIDVIHERIHGWFSSNDTSDPSSGAPQP